MIRIGHVETMLRGDPDGGGGGGSGELSLQDRQRLAYNFGVDPNALSAEELKKSLQLLDLAAQLGKSPQEMIQFQLMQDSGLFTTSLLQKLLLGDMGGGGADTRPREFDDPRYWQMEQEKIDQGWAQLSQEDRIAAQKIQADLINAGLDAETARRQALASLIQSRNANSIDLAQTSGNIAAQAAQFAANPRDAIAELQYRNATGVGPAFGSIGNANFGGYQSKLDDKFQNLFGGVAGDLSRAREYVNSIPPTEFFGAETRQQLGLPLLPQQEMLQPQQAAPNPLDALMQKLQGMSAPDKEAFRRYTDPAYREQQTRIEDAYAKDPKAAEEFFRKLTELNQGVVPSRAEDGINMNIHEPAAVVGMSGRIYATMAENDPEQLRVIPIPSVKKARAEAEKKQKEREKSGASVRDGDPFHAARMKFLEETRGAERMAYGGSITVDDRGRVTSPNPYGPELPGYRNTHIGVGFKRDAAGNKVYQSTERFSPKGSPKGVDIAQRMRAGKFNFAGLGSKKRGRGSGGGVDLASLREYLRNNGGGPRWSSSTRQAPGMPMPNDTGYGTPTSGQNNQQNPVLNDFFGNIRQQLSMLGANTPAGQGLPDPRMLANGVLSRNETDPVLQAYIEAAYSRLGIDPRTLWATASQYRPTGLNTGGGVPSVRFV